jgi:hypothetical protein
MALIPGKESFPSFSMMVSNIPTISLIPKPNTVSNVFFTRFLWSG